MFLRARRPMRDDSGWRATPSSPSSSSRWSGFALLAAVTVLVGWLLKTYVLPEHGIGHADEHVNVWLAQHRAGTRNDVSFWLSGIGDVFAIPALVAITAIVAMVMRRWRVAAFIVAAIAIEAATYRVATWVIHRQRPSVPRLDDLPVDASYYSGPYGRIGRRLLRHRAADHLAHPQRVDPRRRLDDRDRHPAAGRALADVSRHAPPHRRRRRPCWSASGRWSWRSPRPAPRRPPSAGKTDA